MNSREALDILDRVHPDDLETVAGEDGVVRAALEAVATDEDATRLRAARERFDHHVSRIVGRTPAPADDLQARLFDSLGLGDDVTSASRTTAADSVPAGEPIRTVSRRGALRAFVAAAGVAAAAGLGLWFSRRPAATPLTVDGLRERGVAVFDEVSDLPTTDVTPMLPHGWLGGPITVSTVPRGLSIAAGEPVSASVYEFALVERGRRIRGLLIAVPTTELVDPPSLRFFDPGGANYAGPFDSVAWQEGRTTYVCLVHDGDLGPIESALSFAVPV